jgi:hypothetical protein
MTTEEAHAIFPINELILGVKELVALTPTNAYNSTKRPSISPKILADLNAALLKNNVSAQLYLYDILPIFRMFGINHRGAVGQNHAQRFWYTGYWIDFHIAGVGKGSKFSSINT